jgi:hypothetical protein
MYSQEEVEASPWPNQLIHCVCTEDDHRRYRGDELEDAETPKGLLPEKACARHLLAKAELW